MGRHRQISNTNLISGGISAVYGMRSVGRTHPATTMVPVIGALPMVPAVVLPAIAPAAAPMAAPRRPPKAPPRIAPCTAPRAGVLCARASANGIIDTRTRRQSKPTVRRIVAPYVFFLVACNARRRTLNVYCTGIALECNDELTPVAASGRPSGRNKMLLSGHLRWSAILAPSRPVRANQTSQRLSLSRRADQHICNLSQLCQFLRLHRSNIAEFSIHFSISSPSPHVDGRSVHLWRRS